MKAGHAPDTDLEARHFGVSCFRRVPPLMRDLEGRAWLVGAVV